MPTTAMAMFPHDAGVGGGAAAASLTTANQACYSCRKQVGLPTPDNHPPSKIILNARTEEEV